jgi:ornithine carbamoyltransferase
MTTMALPVILPKNDLLTGAEWGADTVRELFRLAADIKAHPENYRASLSGKFLAMIFEKPSLRTRVSFDVGMQSLGGSTVFLDYEQQRLGVRESIRDMARNLERWVQGIVARVFEQSALEQLAEHGRVPVINALSNRFHPCQALADFFTLEEKCGSLAGLKLAYVGDGNNVCHSLISVAARVGAHLCVATPEGFEPDAGVAAEACRTASATGAKIEFFYSPQEAVEGAGAVYTDVWTSMGYEEEAAERAGIFAPFQVNRALMSRAAPGALFLHCLPAHRGAEVTAEVIDSPQSVVYDQAENRMHVQKAILLTLLG